jgi:tRNA threonylcarbamoyladenosine biosynthesis protein TsaB
MPKTRDHGMNVLAFDTCLGAVSVAVRWGSVGGQSLLRGRFEAREGGHAERLMPMVAETLDEAGLAFADLDRIAVTVGPGTFTGVRVGVAAARGLALASGLPVVATTSLAVMAHQAVQLLEKSDADPIAVAVDARRGMVYFQLFGQPAGGTMQGPYLLEAADVAAIVGARPVVVVGSGAQAAAQAIIQAGGQAQTRLTDLDPDARALALMAESLEPVHPLRPLYLRAPDAKPQADKSLTRALSP